MASLLPATVLAPAAEAADDPSHVSFTLEGCRNPTVDLELSNFICADGDYTTGNLGKTWNELDLVPHRITTRLGNQAAATTTYTVAIVADNEDAGHPGYDVMSEPIVNAAKSDGSCSVSAGSQLTATPGVGGTDASIYRLLTITQDRGTTCVFDYYERLALGSHLFPGSSLHSNLTNQNLGTQGVGAKDVSIPVKEILPQELSKDMAAFADVDHVWNLIKESTPANIDFLDECVPDAPHQATFEVTISWTREPVSGGVTVTTNVYATNPAHRSITVQASDDIYEGGTPSGTPIASATGAPVDVAAGTTELVLTHIWSGSSSATEFSDRATATYIDTDTGIPVPGSTEATASATVQQGDVTNETAVITDVETLTDPSGELSFSVDAVTGATGTFGGGYTLGTPTTGPVSWTSTTQIASGSVTFDKTIYVANPVQTTASISDVATLTPSDGTSIQADASTDITVDALVSIELIKTIPNVLTGDETADIVFSLRTDANDAGTEVDSHTFNFAAGDTQLSHTFGGLEPGTYWLVETDTGGFAPRAPVQVTVDLPDCGETVRIDNGFAPGRATVRKVTLPPGGEAGWEFTLTGPGIEAPGVTVTTTDATAIDFGVDLLEEGTYTVTETSKPGWDLTGVNGDGAATVCEFAVDYPADEDAVFECVFENTQQGTIIVEKQVISTDPAALLVDFAFTGDAAGAIHDDEQIVESGLAPGTYTSTETDPSPEFVLTSIVCDDGLSATASTWSLASLMATFELDPGETVTCVFTNTHQGKVRVLKTENGTTPTTEFSFRLNGPNGYSETLKTDGTNLGDLVFGAANGGWLEPGDYELCELAVPAGWTSSLAGFPGATVDPTSGDVCVSFTLDPGEQAEFVIDNTRPEGDQRTIGYWRNWNTCTGGNQAATAERTGHWLVDDLLPISLGDYVVETCQQAVEVLSNPSMKYAEDGTAAQLLGAKLNVAAGAGTCAAATAAIAEADALLVAVNYDGPEPYSGKGKKPAGLVDSRHDLYDEFSAVHSTLDTYNNGELCG